MMTDSPLLCSDALPRFSQIQPAHVPEAIDALLAQYRTEVSKLTATPEHHFDGLMLALESMQQRLANAWAPVGHLHAVADSTELRAAYGPAEEKLTDHAIELGQNKALFAAVQALRDAPTFQDLSVPQQALIEQSLRDFRLSGVSLGDAARERFREIGIELSRLGTEFSNAVLDASEAWSEHLPDKNAVAGIPPSGRDVLREYAREKNLDGYLVTLRQPSVQAVLTHADDRALRQRVYHAYQTRASDQGPNAGRFDNSARIEKIMGLRHEAAQLLGFASAAEESLATKMATDPQQVLDFLRDLAAKAQPIAVRELSELRTFASAELGINPLEVWDVSYAAEKLRQQRHALDEEQIKPYFPLPAVMQGLFALTEKLYGIRVQARDGIDVWHPDVRYYDLLHADGSVLAGVYVDLYARSGKRGGAWMDVCRARFRGGDKAQIPVAFLTCNFAPSIKKSAVEDRPPPSLAYAAGEGGTVRNANGGVRADDSRPALLAHDDVLTLFHEFGHCLHHMLTEIELPSIGGIDGVEWDAVELPSQFMENFGWNRESLNLFARHYQSGEPLPDELFQRMLDARHFHTGLFLCRQIEFALFDFLLHLEYEPERGAHALAVLQRVRDEVAVLQAPEWQRFPHAFGHIFAGGYAAGYYSYLWAELLSSDAFAKFEDHGVIDRETGMHFRREILAVGASRPALASFTAFRGRGPEPAALLASYGLAPAPG